MRKHETAIAAPAIAWGVWEWFAAAGFAAAAGWFAGPYVFGAAWIMGG